jgi:hypothetical protein
MSKKNIPFWKAFSQVQLNKQVREGDHLSAVKTSEAVHNVSWDFNLSLTSHKMEKKMRQKNDHGSIFRCKNNPLRNNYSVGRVGITGYRILCWGDSGGRTGSLSEKIHFIYLE